jgi:hypothetical protein
MKIPIVGPRGDPGPACPRGPDSARRPRPPAQRDRSRPVAVCRLGVALIVTRSVDAFGPLGAGTSQHRPSRSSDDGERTGPDRDGQGGAPGAAQATREFTTETRRAQRLHGAVNWGVRSRAVPGRGSAGAEARLREGRTTARSLGDLRHAEGAADTGCARRRAQRGTLEDCLGRPGRPLSMTVGSAPTNTRSDPANARNRPSADHTGGAITRTPLPVISTGSTRWMPRRSSAGRRTEALHARSWERVPAEVHCPPRRHRRAGRITATCSPRTCLRGRDPGARRAREAVSDPRPRSRPRRRRADRSSGSRCGG